MTDDELLCSEADLVGVIKSLDAIRDVGTIRVNGDRIKATFPKSREAELEPAIEAIRREKQVALALLQPAPGDDKFLRAAKIRVDPSLTVKRCGCKFITFHGTDVAVKIACADHEPRLAEPATDPYEIEKD